MRQPVLVELFGRRANIAQPVERIAKAPPARGKALSGLVPIATGAPPGGMVTNFELTTVCGVKHGVTTMYIHAYVSVPTPTAIVTVVKVKKIHKGPYGTRAAALIPKIAGGAGSLTHFAFSIHRNFKRGGKKQSYLLARCANGRFRAHAVMQASDGSRISGSILRRCAAIGWQAEADPPRRQRDALRRHPLGKRLRLAGLPPQVLQLWLAMTLREGFGLTAAGAFIDFHSLLEASLTALLAQACGVQEDEEALAEELISDFNGLGVHADVEPGLRGLAASGVAVCLGALVERSS